MCDAGQEFTLVGLPGDHRSVATQIEECSGTEVEAEVGLAFFFVRAVAEEALVGENGSDFAIELDLLGSRRKSEREREEGKKRTEHR